MTGKTHRAGGFLCSVIGFAVLKQNGLLIDGVNSGLQWVAMYPFCLWGSVASDLDHHWESSPMKDPISHVFNKSLHLTSSVQKFMENRNHTSSIVYKVSRLLNARHRSWHTHSDLTLGVLFWFLYLLLTNKLGLAIVDTLLLRIIGMGVCLGMIAHFILDMLTTDGVNSMLFTILRKLGLKFLPEKLRFVPRLRCFRTSGAWEEFVYKALKVLNYIALVYLFWEIFGLGNLFPYEITIGA